MGFGTEYVVGWGTLALINAGLAQGKGRSGLSWFLVSLVLGPIATLAIVALDKVDLPVVQRAPIPRSVQLVAGGLILVAIVLAFFGRY
jgi:Flp pilus assembly protein protease CpaA